MPELIIEATQATSIREITPSSVYPDPEVLVIDGSANEVRALIDLDMVVPIGEDAVVSAAYLQLHRSEALPAGPHAGTIAPLDDDFDQDAVTWDTAPATRTPTAAISIPGGGAAGDLDEFEITAMYSASVTADNALGTTWFGVRIVTTATAALKFYSLLADPDYVPKLRVVYSLPGEAPSSPAPNGVTGKAKPYLVAHNPGAEAITAIDVEVATDDTFDGSVVFASGERVKTSAELDLNLEAGFTAMTSGQTRYWRMRTKNEGGLWSPWSEPASMTYLAKLGVVINSPVVEQAAASFTRATVAYKQDGSQVASGVPRYETGKYGSALMVEEGTTNLLSAANSTDFAGWTPVGANRTLDALVDGTITADKMYDDGSNGGHYFWLNAIYTSGQPGASTIVVKKGERTWLWMQHAKTGGTFPKAWFNLDTGVVGTVEAGVTATIKQLPDHPGWYVCTIAVSSVDAAAPGVWAGLASTDGVWSYAGDGASGLYLWRAQAEIKPYATSWQIGGTARNAETDHEIAGSNFSATAGTIERWYKPTSAFGTSLRYLFDGEGAANQNLEIWVGTDGKPHAKYGTGAAEVTLDGPSALSSTDQSHIAVRWSSAGVALFVGGASVDSDATAPGLTFGALCAIGHKADNTLQQNGLTDDLRISSIARTDAEIAAVAASSEPAPMDAYTTYLSRFDSSLTPEINNVIATPVPTYEWDVTGGDMAAREVEVLKRVDGILIPYHLWVMQEITPAASGEVTQPDSKPLIPGDYRVYVRVRDDEDRHASPGDLIETEAFDDFTMQAAGSVD